MIETIYNDEISEEENIKLPKNIHQIGSGETKYHIYIEDKVSRFLELLPENEKNIRYGVLLGSVKFSKGEVYMFIRSVVEVREVLDNTLLFGDDVWTGIYDDIKRYYHGDKIVGWYTSIYDFEERDLFHMRKLHLDHFAGNDKVFLNIDREEEEKDFYFYANGDLQKVKCYHIYYEKNQELEKYIFETHYDLNSKRRNIKTKTEVMPEQKTEQKTEDMQSNEEEEIKSMELVSDNTSEEDTKNIADEAEEKDIYQKLIMFSGKAASVFVIGALVFTIGVMYRKGQLDNLTQEMKEVVAGIMNKNDTTELDNVVLIDESKNNTEEDKSKTTDESQSSTEPEETSTEPDTSAVEIETSAQETQPEPTEEETVSVLPSTTQYYEVQRGDTLYGICQKLYGNTNNIGIIMELNHLDSPDSITSGKTLIVP